MARLLAESMATGRDTIPARLRTSTAHRRAGAQFHDLDDGT